MTPDPITPDPPVATRPDPTPEPRASLWLLVAGPALWAVHFLACYITGAIHCAKALPEAPLGGTRIALAVYTVLALGGILAFGWRGLRHHTWGHGRLPHDADSPGDRHRFVGFASLLLCGLSAVAVVYTAMAIVVIGTCR